MGSRFIRQAAIVFSASALTVPLLGSVAQAAPDSRADLPGTVPGWATPARVAATPPASQKVSFTVALSLRNVDAAERLAVAVSDPASDQYQKYLTPPQFNAKFAPSDDQVARVRKFLTSYGIKVDGVAEANRWVSATGTVAQVNKAFAKGQYTEKVFKPFGLQAECGGEEGWNGEETLDVEAVHSLAPGAKIHYVGARDCDQGIDEAINYVVQHKAADIVSNSYGNLGEDIPAAEIAKEHAMFVQAAAEGIGFYFSSGDSGDEVTLGNTPSAQPDYPASDPFATAVGGTSLGVDAAGQYQFETGWGTDIDRVDYTKTPPVYTEPVPGSFFFGAGGGTSTLFPQPSYQRGKVPAALSRQFGGAPARVVPDVAAIADPFTGFVIGETLGGQFRLDSIGGTSLACPVFAAIQAVASTGRRAPIGFANPLLYGLKSSVYHDVVPSRVPIAVATPSGSALVTFDRDSTLATSFGYDNVTGLGSPRGAGFLTAVRTGR